MSLVSGLGGRIEGLTGFAKSRNPRIVLLGKTGAGKSALGNLILKKNVFISKPYSDSETIEPMSDSAYIENIHVTVVDTPGLYSNSHTLLKTGTSILDSLQMLKNGPNVFIVVIRLGRFTVEDDDTIDLLKTMLGPDFLQHGIVVFTHEDQVTKNNSVNEVINRFKNHPKRKAILDECDGRYLTVNCDETNEEKRTEKRRDLLPMICTVTKNGTKYNMKDSQVYRSVFLRHAEQYTVNRLTLEQMQLLWKEQGRELQKTREQLAKKKRIIAVTGVALACVAAPQLAGYVGGSAAAAIEGAAAAAGSLTFAATVGIGGIISRKRKR